MVNLGKAFEAATIPTFLIILITVILSLASALQALDSHICISIVIFTPLFAWAGYKATKELKQDLFTAGLAGIIAVVLSEFVTGLFYIIFIMPIYGDQFSLIPPSPFLVALIIKFPFSIILNFIIALLGGFIGQKR